MTQPFVPRPSGAPAEPAGRAPVDPAVSEATRLLCAGAYLDPRYRETVIDELYVHEERLPAPSFGFDATRVLSHAMRARRAETGWALGLLVLWVVAVPLTRNLFLSLWVPCLLLAFARAVRGKQERPPWARIAGAFLVRWFGRVLLALTLLGLLLLGFGDGGSGGLVGGLLEVVTGLLWFFLPEGLAAPTLTGEPARAWLTLVLFTAIAVTVALQRGFFARVMIRELAPGPAGFGNRRSDPAEALTGRRLNRLRARIAAEQYSPTIMYRADDPFCGAGVPFRPWSLAVELRPQADRSPEPIDNAQILRRVRPLVEGLRVPSGTPERARGVRDRLRELVIDECVFLPVDGLPGRALAPYAREQFEGHRSRSVEEGGEARRHFLRIRVGAWEEEVVVTVFVRVHTQGGMLMLEVAPHVLHPVRRDFQSADRIAHRYLHNNPVGKAAWALAHTPTSIGGALVTLIGAMNSGWRLLTGGQAGALPDGPALSVRELGSAWTSSLFQEMDFDRYLKTIEDRVADGVTAALRDAGWQTEEFSAQITNVINGGVNIGSVRDSAFAVGGGNQVTHRPAGNGGPGPGSGSGPGTRGGGGHGAAG
ncbi:hypothetical protein [Streptomyces sp. NPDC051561]|uniref:hypothetical protein n=1 Tax=Streptomyces sp. NPDC051561 TaxID=3365658 RepID=UPI0037B6DB09